MASADEKQFGNLNYQQIKEKEDAMKNTNSLKNERKSVDTFKSYLKSINVEDTNFFVFTESELDKHLATFWWNARTNKGEKYKASSLDTLCHGLKRALKEYGQEFDITDKKSLSFQGNCKAFKSAMKDLKQSGKGHVSHPPEIMPTGKFLFILCNIQLTYIQSNKYL